MRKHFKMPFFFFNFYSFQEVLSGSFLCQDKSSVIIFSKSQIILNLLALKYSISQPCDCPETFTQISSTELKLLNSIFHVHIHYLPISL